MKKDKINNIMKDLEKEKEKENLNDSAYKEDTESDPDMEGDEE